MSTEYDPKIEVNYASRQTQAEAHTLRLALEGIVADNPTDVAWVQERQVEAGVHQANRIAATSLHLTRETLAAIAQETEQFVSAYPTLETSVREMTESVTRILQSVPERAVRNYLSQLDGVCTPSPVEQSTPQQTFLERMKRCLPHRR